MATIRAGMDVLAAISLSSDQRGWIALAIAMICIGYLLFRPKFRKKDPLEKPAFGSVAQQRSVERQMQNLLVELSEMTRQMNAQIDTRAAKLEQLIKEADQRIAALRGAETDPTKEAPAPTIASSPVEHVTPTFETDPRHAEIYSLADQGQGIKEIASRVGQPTGEIELILALRPRA
jgi:hypothetical protein